MVHVVSVSSVDLNPSGYSVSADMFGVIQTGFNGFGEFQQLYEYLGGTHLRWPGGTLSEQRPEVYGLDIPGLFDATDLYAHNPNRVRPQLDDMITYANERDDALSVLIPTARYEGDPATAAAEFSGFLADLDAGVHGDLDELLTLEIGNEYISNVAGGAAAYGAIADALLDVYEGYLAANPGFALDWDIEITVQLGYNEGDNGAILGALSADNLYLIDDVIVHNLPLRFEAIDKPQSGGSFGPGDLGEAKWENAVDYLDDWTAAFAALGLEAPDFNLSAWTIGSSEMDPENVDLNYQDYGLRQASAALEIFATYVAAGVDIASLWGVGVNNLNNFATFQDGEMELSHGGVMFRWLSESVQGKVLHDGFEANDRGDSYIRYAFEDDDQIVVFVAANDLGAGDLALRLDFAGYGNFFAARVDTLKSSDGSWVNGPAEDRLTEDVLVETEQRSVVTDTVNLEFSMDYEVKRIILAKTEAGAQAMASLESLETNRGRLTTDEDEAGFLPPFCPGPDCFEFSPAPDAPAVDPGIVVQDPGAGRDRDRGDRDRDDGPSFGARASGFDSDTGGGNVIADFFDWLF